MKHEGLFDKLTPLFKTVKIQTRSDSSFAENIRDACGEASTARELYDIRCGELGNVLEGTGAYQKTQSTSRRCPSMYGETLA